MVPLSVCVCSRAIEEHTDMMQVYVYLFLTWFETDRIFFKIFRTKDLGNPDAGNGETASVLGVGEHIM